LLDFHGLGINGKISELQAAMGLAVLPHMAMIFEARKKVVDFYDSHLDFSKLTKMKLRNNTEWNYSYYPVVFETEAQLLAVQKVLNDNEIFPRRYFYPSLNTINYIKGKKMPVSESVASRIMCLPLYDGLEFIELEKICNKFTFNV
jgi:dTDP-4-amino-4,6-dideoxygalactose transaminase